MIGRDGDRELKNSMLSLQLDVDDDIFLSDTELTAFVR